MTENGRTAYLPAANLTQCHVLVVDDDRACLDEYAEIVDSLGYRCARAPDARSALHILAEDDRIGIVVTDLQMPAMDGISFLDELSARFAPVRPIVALVVTGFGSLDTAVQAMRFNAIDFLSKPVSRDSFSAALRRASNRWAQLVGQLRLAAMSGAGGPLPVGREGGESAPAGNEAPAVPDQAALLAFVRSVILSRQKRADYLDADLFSDPAWDILLDLTSARLEGKAVPVSSACAAAHVPFSTAFRHVGHLVESGLVRRWKDPADRRRDLLELHDETMTAMTRYLTAVMQREGAGLA